MAWVLGEYGYTLGGEELPGIADKLCSLAERQHSDPDTKTYIVSALIKLVAQMVRPCMHHHYRLGRILSKLLSFTPRCYAYLNGARICCVA